MVGEAKKSILITGADGMLGRALCEHLRNKYKIIALTRKDCDITDKKKVVEIFRSLKPSLVIHTAAFTDVDACERYRRKAYAVNAGATHNIAKAASGIVSLLIYISTDYVFDGKSKKPYSERSLAHPVNVYGRTKLKGEEFVRRLVKKHIIIRTSWLFGCGRHNFVDDIIERAKAAGHIRIVKDKYSSPTYINDLASAAGFIINLAGSRRWRDAYYGTYHITNSGSCTWYAYAKHILKYANIKGVRVDPISIKEIAFVAKRPVFSVLDNSKYISLVHRPLRPWQKAVKEYVSLVKKQRNVRNY